MPLVVAGTLEAPSQLTESHALALPQLGIQQTRHELSHHNGDPEQMRRLSLADEFLVEQLARFLDALKASDDGGEPLLDRTLVLFGSGMAYGHSHGNANLPTLLAGGRALGVRHGAHVWLYPGGYNMGPRDAGGFGADGFGVAGLSYAAAAVSEQMARFSLGLGEEARAGAVGIASVLVLAAAVTIALQASTLARLRREAARGSPEERARLTSRESENGRTPKSAFTDDVLEG